MGAGVLRWWRRPPPRRPSVTRESRPPEWQWQFDATIEAACWAAAPYDPDVLRVVLAWAADRDSALRRLWNWEDVTS